MNIEEVFNEIYLAQKLSQVVVDELNDLLNKKKISTIQYDVAYLIIQGLAQRLDYLEYDSAGGIYEELTDRIDDLTDRIDELEDTTNNIEDRTTSLEDKEKLRPEETHWNEYKKDLEKFGVNYLELLHFRNKHKEIYNSDKKWLHKNWELFEGEIQIFKNSKKQGVKE